MKILRGNKYITILVFFSIIFIIVSSTTVECVPPLEAHPVLQEVVSKGLIILDPNFWNNIKPDLHLTNTIVKQIIEFIKEGLSIKDLIDTFHDNGVLMTVYNLKEILKIIINTKVGPVGFPLLSEDLLGKIQEYYDLLTDIIDKDSKPKGDMSSIKRIVLLGIIIIGLIGLYLIDA